MPNVDISGETWTQLTTGDISAGRFQNISADSAFLMATVGAVAPTGRPDGAVMLSPGAIIAADLTLDQLWPGVPGANRVYAYLNSGGTVSVSHA